MWWAHYPRNSITICEAVCKFLLAKSFNGILESCMCGPPMTTSFWLSFTCERLKATCDKSQLTQMKSHQRGQRPTQGQMDKAWPFAPESILFGKSRAIAYFYVNKAAQSIHCEAL